MPFAEGERKKRQEWKSIFDMLDTTRSGAITVKQLKIALKGIGLRLDTDEIRTLIREHDAGGSEEVEFLEFCEIMSSKEKELAISEALGTQKRRKGDTAKKYHLSADGEEETKRVFDSFDSDQSGNELKGSVLQLCLFLIFPLLSFNCQAPLICRS